MQTNFKLINPNELDDYEDLANEIAGASWPEFMLHDPIADNHWHELFERFGDFQFAMFDNKLNRMAAIGNSLPFHWKEPLEDLPNGGWDWVFLKAIADQEEGKDPNIQSAIQVAIHPEYQGQGLSSKMVRAMRSIGISKGYKYLVAPVRPNRKSLYPLFSIGDYITWVNDDGLPYDAWLRVHVRLGARIIKPCHEAMTISGTCAEWEKWTGLNFPQSGRYIIPHSLNPIEMDIEKDIGTYIEPNVWLVHML